MSSYRSNRSYNSDYSATIKAKWMSKDNVGKFISGSKHSIKWLLEINEKDTVIGLTHSLGAGNMQNKLNHISSRVFCNNRLVYEGTLVETTDFQYSFDYHETEFTVLMGRLKGHCINDYLFILYFNSSI